MIDTITTSRLEWETLKRQFQLIASQHEPDDVEAFCNAGLEFMASIEHPDEVQPKVDPAPENHKGRHETCDKGGFWVLVKNPAFHEYVKCNKCGETCVF